MGREIKSGGDDIGVDSQLGESFMRFAELIAALEAEIGGSGNQR